MNICDEKKEKQAPELIMGHLYQHKDGGIYICAYEDRLIALQNGCGWSGSNGFGKRPYEFTDVTDLYCLKRIED